MKQEGAGEQKIDDKVRHNQEVVQQIPRNSENLTSNSDEKQPQPAEHTEPEEK